MRKRTAGILTILATEGLYCIVCRLYRECSVIGHDVHRHEADRGSGSSEAGRCAVGRDRNVHGDADRHDAEVDAHLRPSERRGRGGAHPSRQEGRAGQQQSCICVRRRPTACKSPIKGSAKVSAAWIKDMTAGKTYVNIHTKKNLNGEIRGQVGM